LLHIANGDHKCPNAGEDHQYEDRADQVHAFLLFYHGILGNCPRQNLVSRLEQKQAETEKRNTTRKITVATGNVALIGGCSSCC